MASPPVLPRGSIRVLGEISSQAGPLTSLVIETLTTEETGQLAPLPSGALTVTVRGDVPPRELAATPDLQNEVMAAIRSYRTIPAIPGLKPGAPPAIMGILNLTPDSFSDGGQWNSTEAALTQADLMLEGGAEILDIGGESTRPGAARVNAKEEMHRVIPVIAALRPRTKALISIDTQKAEVAREALATGADWVNDISALTQDPEMAPLCAAAGCPVVLMHMRGTPETMQKNVTYHDVVAEIHAYLRERAAFALQAGIGPGMVLLDPGIGFGKRPADNLVILKRLAEFRTLGLPLLLGSSRKSFIGLCLDKPVTARLWGTAATVAAAVLAGARVIRVHDVEAMHDVTCLATAIREGVMHEERVN